MSDLCFGGCCRESALRQAKAGAEEAPLGAALVVALARAEELLAFPIVVAVTTVLV